MRKNSPIAPGSQTGSMLLEALIAILIFSIGILALVAMQATAIKNSIDAKYRADASYFANQLIAQMWVDDPATLKTNYDSPSGAKYKAWLDEIKNAQSQLPSVTATVTVDPNNVATVTVFWQQPGTADIHNFVAYAQIK